VVYLSPWVTVEHNAGFSEEAVRNPYMAAEEFLSRFDVDVERENGLALLDDLPSTADTILIASSRRSLSTRRLDALTDWVYDGGALIVRATDLYDDDRDDKGDELLNRFGIWLYEAENSSSETETSTSVGEAIAGIEKGEEADLKPKVETPKNFGDVLRAMDVPKDNCKYSPGLTAIDFEGEDRELQANLSTSRHLYFEDEQDYIYSANDSGAQFVYVPHGQGSIYVLTSLNQWRNRNIGCFDHAHFLRTITGGTPTLWLMFNTDIEPWYKLIWQQWPVAVFLTFLWLMLWLWRSAYRSARIESAKPIERRAVMEHIEGMSRFLYQQGELGLLLSGLRSECFRGDPKDPKQKDHLATEVARWSELLKVSEKRIHWALTADLGRDGNALTKAVALLQKMRELPKKRQYKSQ